MNRGRYRITLASENTSRLAAMQRAQIFSGLMENLHSTFRLHQTGIVEEHFDEISGFEALRGGNSSLDL